MFLIVFGLNLNFVFGQSATETIWDPFNPVVYFIHTILGTLGVISAFVALFALKGGKLHIRMGWIFTLMVVVSAVTAILFSFTAIAPLAISSGLIVIGLVLSSILAIRARSRSVKIGEWAAFVLLAISFLALFAQSALISGTVLGLIPLPPPPPDIVIPPMSAMATMAVTQGVYALIVLAFLIGDIKFFRLNSEKRSEYRFRRHLSRMAFALAIAVHAPVVTFGNDLGLNPLVAFFGPFIIYPVIMYSLRKHRLLNRNTAINI